MGGYVQLSRPLNCVMAAAGVFIGGVVAIGAPAWGSSAIDLLLAAAAAASFTAGGNTLNDIYDRETDKVNHPDRPIPSGRVAIRSAKAFAAIAFALAAAVAYLVNLEALLLVLVNLAVMFSYEARFKSRGFSGNLAIAYLVGSLFLFGGLAVYERQSDALVRVGILAMLAFLTTVAREITKDIEDMAGDVDRRTLPQRIGAGRAGVIAAAFFVFGVLLSLLPWSLSLFRLPYLAVVLLADGMFIYAALYSARSPRQSQRVAKVAMIVSLVAFLIGGAYEGLQPVA